MPVYFACPANVPNPPMIMVAMEIFGLHEYIKDVTRRLAKLGAFVIAPDYYFRKGEDLTKITEMPKLMPIVNSKPDAELLSDLDATAAWAKSQGGDTNRLGIMGFCRGGRTVWEYAANGRSQGGGRVLRPPGRPGDTGIDLAQEPDRPCATDAGAGARSLWRSGSRHPPHAGGCDEGCIAGRREDVRDQGLSRRAARLSCRLSRKLPQCDHPPQTLLAVQRSVEDGEIRERFRTLRPREAAAGADRLHAHARAFTFHEVEGDDEPAEEVDLLGLIKTDRMTTDRR